jgi:hypothetical protein
MVVVAGYLAATVITTSCGFLVLLLMSLYRISHYLAETGIEPVTRRF